MFSFLPKRLPYFLIVILIVAAFFRLYNLPGTLTFLGDQGRDALLVSGMFKNFEPVFIGPVTSVGNMYLGPLYYYFMLPFLMMSYPSPMGPVYAMAILGIVGVYLIYQFGLKMFGTKIAYLAATMAALCVVWIELSRFSWNPNPAPFVALIMIYANYLAWQKNLKYWILVALCFAILIQLHYLTLLSGIAAGIIYLWQFIETVRTNHSFSKTFSKFLKPTLLSILVVVLSFTPLVLFDLKHSGTNLKALAKILTTDDNFAISAKENFIGKLSNNIKEIDGRSSLIIIDQFFGKSATKDRLLLGIFIIGLVISVKFEKDKSKLKSMAILIIYLVAGIIGTAFYQHSIFTHYIAYLIPMVIYLWAIVIVNLFNFKNKYWLSPLSIMIVLLYLSWNLQHLPLKSLSWTVSDISRLTDAIYTKIKPNEKYNIVLISATRDFDGQNYRYFFSTKPNPPALTEDRFDVDALIIIDEEKKTDVLSLPVYEISVFPDKHRDEIWMPFPNSPEVTILRK